ncbi:hypothetical protein Taro_018195 [Colocasia esculenta]|uniref:Calmodulin-binding domain-containing protein n=1 Tax=Colocasia esculenta TaxID=4460 RepID=A0A843UQC5_COLES|nr:hypothetical protein [Colocasia esculenta]
MNEEETTRGLFPGTPDTISSKEEGRNSSGKGATTPSLSPKDDRKVVPRYLGASVGSCHDFCKYGRKHSFRSKEKHRAFPLSAGSRIIPEKEQSRVKIPSLAERRKKSSTKQKSLKTGLYDKHVILEEDSLSTLKAIEPDESKNIDEDAVFLEKHELSEGPEDAQNKPSRNPFASIKSKIMQKVPSPVKKAISAAKSKVSKQEAPSPLKRSDASARPALSGKSKGTNLKSASPLNSTEGTTNGNYESTKVKSADPPIHREKKLLKPPSTSLSSQPTFNRVSSITLRKVKITRSSSVKRQKKVEKAENVSEKIKEKTLYVIAPRSAGDKTQQSCASSSSVLKREQKHKDSDSASVPKHPRAKAKKPVQNAEKKTPRKGVTNHPEDKDPTAQKLTFRRGKVVDPQFVNDTPRRLVFRPGRKMGNSQSGKFGRRSFKNKDSAHGDTHHSCPEAQIVVLKHQGVPDKKETQGLYNDVIEETANKLAETRKSKVKALVGAFETVISLQESRPSPQV